MATEVTDAEALAVALGALWAAVVANEEQVEQEDGDGREHCEPEDFRHPKQQPPEGVTGLRAKSRATPAKTQEH